MDNLFTRFDREFCANDGWLKIVAASWSENNLELGVSVLMCKEGTHEHWKIECTQVFDEFISSGYVETISLSNSSPLLIPYLDHEVEIGFSENEMSPDELFGTITSACYEIMGDSANIARFINLQTNKHGICSSKHGILGRFPERIARKISQELDGRHIKVKMPEGYPPKYWSDNEYHPYPNNLLALSIGESYVIGTTFEATQQT